MKKGFTLVELLVVVAIVGILAAVLVSNLFGGTESARSTQCLANMAQLAKAAQLYGQNKHHYPLAGSVEVVRTVEDSSGNTSYKEVYAERKGWISWNSQGYYANNPTTGGGNAGWFASAYDDADKTREYVITNGALWKYANRSRKIYTCPGHRKTMKKQNPNWSYVMNSYFGWAGDSCEARDDGYWGRSFNGLRRIDRTLLFAELQWESGYVDGVTPNTSKGSGTVNDCVLQYGKDERIGFNHKEGQDTVAHVVFADGHTEKIRYPKKGLSASNLKELTEFLCEGTDYYFNGSKFEESK